MLKVYSVTLVHPIREDEVCVEVAIDSDRFVDILEAVSRERERKRLSGYQIHEILEYDTPF